MINLNTTLSYKEMLWKGADRISKLPVQKIEVGVQQPGFWYTGIKKPSSLDLARGREIVATGGDSRRWGGHLGLHGGEQEDLLDV
jgi:hypothetical protein